MNDAIDRDALLRRLDDARALLLAAIEGVSEADLARPLEEGGWTAQTVLDHIEAWDAFATDAVREVLRGGTPTSPADVDVWNAAAVAERRGRSPAATLAALDESRRTLRDGLRAAPEHQWVRNPNPDLIDLPGLARVWAEHDEEHAAELRAWRDHATVGPETG